MNDTSSYPSLRTGTPRPLLSSTNIGGVHQWYEDCGLVVGTDKTWYILTAIGLGLPLVGEVTDLQNRLGKWSDGRLDSLCKDELEAMVETILDSDPYLATTTTASQVEKALKESVGQRREIIPGINPLTLTDHELSVAFYQLGLPYDDTRPRLSLVDELFNYRLRRYRFLSDEALRHFAHRRAIPGATTMTSSQLIDVLEGRAREEFARNALGKSVRRRNHRPRVPIRPRLATLLESSGGPRRTPEYSDGRTVAGTDLPSPFDGPGDEQEEVSPPSSGPRHPSPSMLTRFFSRLNQPARRPRSASRGEASDSLSGQLTNPSPLKFEVD